MLFLFVSATIALLLMVLAAEHVANRFRHTRRSRRLLALEGGLALAAGFAVAWTSFPNLHPAVRILIGLALAAPLAVFAAFITVETWRKQKQQAFDRHIARLRREMDLLLDQLDRVRWQAERARFEEARRAEQEQPRTDRRRALEEDVRRWQGTGGVARLRTIKIQDWQAELAEAADDDLRRREAALESALEQEADAERREMVRAQLAVVRLERMTREGDAPETAAPPPERPSERLEGEKARLEEKLRVLQTELTDWERKRAAFLAQRIPLD